MRISETFKKKLKRQDKLLDVVWHPQSSRYWIIRKDPERGDCGRIMVSESPSGQYRDLGDWIINELKRRDAWNDRRRREIMAMWSKVEAEKLEKFEKDMTDWVHGELSDVVKHFVKNNNQMNYTAPSSKPYDRDHHLKHCITKREAWRFLNRSDVGLEDKGIVSKLADGTFTVKS